MFLRVKLAEDSTLGSAEAEKDASLGQTLINLNLINSPLGVNLYNQALKEGQAHGKCSVNVAERMFKL